MLSIFLIRKLQLILIFLVSQETFSIFINFFSFSFSICSSFTALIIGFSTISSFFSSSFSSLTDFSFSFSFDSIDLFSSSLLLLSVSLFSWPSSPSSKLIENLISFFLLFVLSSFFFFFVSSFVSLLFEFIDLFSLSSFLVSSFTAFALFSSFLLSGSFGSFCSLFSFNSSSFLMTSFCFSLYSEIFFFIKLFFSWILFKNSWYFLLPSGIILSLFFKYSTKALLVKSDVVPYPNERVFFVNNLNNAVELLYLLFFKSSSSFFVSIPYCLIKFNNLSSIG